MWLGETIKQCREAKEGARCVKVCTVTGLHVHFVHFSCTSIYVWKDIHIL